MEDEEEDGRGREGIWRFKKLYSPSFFLWGLERGGGTWEGGILRFTGKGPDYTGTGRQLPLESSTRGDIVSDICHAGGLCSGWGGAIGGWSRSQAARPR